MRIPGYFINLTSAAARADHMEKEAQRLGLTLQRVEAIDGRLLSEEEIDLLHRPAAGMHRMSGPEVACFLSHREAWRQIVNANMRFGAVFEDDLTFALDARTLLNDDQWLPADADILKIETTSRRALLLPPFCDVPGGRSAGILASAHLGAGGYILSRTMAARLFEQTKTFGVPVDYLLFVPDRMIFPEVPRWQLFPAICVQQVRSGKKFLPQGAETSGLDAARQILKRSGWAKMRRELERPFVALLASLRARYTAIRSGGKWLFIKYRA